MRIRTRPGRTHPLGATWDGEGVDFALFSEHATKVELCLFALADDVREIDRIPLDEPDEHMWTLSLPDGAKLRPRTLVLPLGLFLPTTTSRIGRRYRSWTARWRAPSCGTRTRSTGGCRGSSVRDSAS